MPMLGIMASSITGGLSTASFESIATATASGGQTVLSFTSIPSTYKHLQIRGLYRDSRTTNSSGILSIKMQFNSDTTDANYAEHNLYGTGAAAAATGNTSFPYVGLGISTGPSAQTTMYGANIIDIQNYASTTQNKTTRVFAGSNQNTSTANDDRIQVESALWLSTAAITRIDLTCIYVSFAANTTFALYGIKG